MFAIKQAHETRKHKTCENWRSARLEEMKVC